MKRDQRQRGQYLGGIVPFGCRVGDAGELAVVPEQQAALKRMQKLRRDGVSLHAIADCYSARRLTPYRRRTLTPDMA